jgi:predicted HicB family RNase H-like nuclease
MNEKVSILLRVNKELREAIKTAAWKSRQSMNAFIEKVLEKKIEKEKKGE